MRRSVLAAVVLLVVSGPASGLANADHTTVEAATGSDRAPASARAIPDFNGDGYADLAVRGNHYPDDVNLPHWVVSVIYGSARGLTAARNQAWTQLDFPDEARPLRLVGDTAAGDFDGDGYTDLAIGLYPADPELVPLTGAVRILYGSRAGLQKGRTRLLTSTSPGLPAFRAAEDYSFGSTLVAANFGRSSHDDLAIGAPERDNGGQITVLYGSSTGLVAAGSQLWSQATPGIPGNEDPEDYFGAELAAGPFSGRPYADLAVGVPGDGGRGDDDGPGAVNIIPGSETGLTAAGSQLWSQASPGIKGHPVDGDGFGSALAVGHFAGRVTADLAIGVRADTAAREYGGAVNVLYGSPTGLDARGDQLWTPRSAGLAGKKYLDAFFGGSLAAGNFGRDHGGRRFDDLVVGAGTDYEDRGSSGQLGVVEVLYGTPKGLSAKSSQVWRWDRRGIKGNPPIDQDSYGDMLTAADFGSGPAKPAYDDLAVGDTLFPTSTNTYGAVGVIPGSTSGLTPRGDQLWTIQKLHRRIPQFFGE
jgi:hypothetical protein